MKAQVPDSPQSPVPDSDTGDPVVARVITLEDALRGLRLAVAEKGPGYVYADQHDFCRYAEETGGGVEPRCIVGSALAHLGVPVSFLARTELEHVTAKGLPIELLNIGIQVDVLARDVLYAAQDVQDQSVGMKNDGDPEDVWRQNTWGAALAAAEQAAQESAR
jgi:hypothetical protein